MPQKDQPRFVSLLTKNAVALILASQRGDQLNCLTRWRAKPAVPFGGKFRIIDFTLSNCINSGIRRIGLLTQYKSHSLIRHVQRGWGFLSGNFNEFIELHPASQRVDEDSWYRGTADAIYQNLDLLRIYKPEHVLVLAGDYVYKMDYGEMLAQHAETKADMTVASIEMPLCETGATFDVMTVDEKQRVTSFVKKRAEQPEISDHSNHVFCSMGIYIFNADFLYEQLIYDADDPKSGHDFGQDVIPRLIRVGYRVMAHRFNESCVHEPNALPYWRNLGTIDAYWEANLELTQVSPALNLYDRDWPIWTYQEQLPPAKLIFDDDNRRGMAVDSVVSGGCVISGATVRQSVLFSNVRVLEGSILERAVVLPDVRIGKGVVIKNAVIDKSCQIPDGYQIGINPEEDRTRFQVTEKGVTLVTPEMLGQLQTTKTP
jgi:glucose-1-phosphate adenylyltransferase